MPQAQRTPLDIHFQADAEPVILTLKEFVSNCTWVFLSDDFTWGRHSGGCSKMCPIVPTSTIWEASSWGNPFLFATGKATRFATLALKVHNFFSMWPCALIIGENKKLKTKKQKKEKTHTKPPTNKNPLTKQPKKNQAP